MEAGQDYLQSHHEGIADTLLCCMDMTASNQDEMKNLVADFYVQSRKPAAQ